MKQGFSTQAKAEMFVSIAALTMSGEALRANAAAITFTTFSFLLSWSYSLQPGSLRGSSLSTSNEKGLIENWRRYEGRPSSSNLQLITAKGEEAFA